MAIDSLRTTGELYGGLDVAVVLTWTRLVPYDPGVVSGPVEACYPPEGGYVEDLEAYALVGPSTGPTLNALPVTEHEAGERQWDYWMGQATDYADDVEDGAPYDHEWND